MNAKRILAGILAGGLLAIIPTAEASKPEVVTPEFSKAGFWEVAETGREVYSFNLGWRFHKGDVAGAEALEFDDGAWPVVNCPHGLEYISTETSGSSNYRGVAWYRKHFKYEKETTGRLVKLHFEAVMGKCKVWLNGEFVGEHFGGYLPFTVDLSGRLKPNEENVIAVMADNSDDPTYPPGKEQTRLDFAYFGGIYRDVWLVSTSKVYITNANEAGRVAGGGVFTHTEVANEDEAVLSAAVDLRNELGDSVSLSAELSLHDPAGEMVAREVKRLVVAGGASAVVKTRFRVRNPHLWTPWSPNLYRLEVVLRDEQGNPLDGVGVRTGLRTIEFRSFEGLFLNGKPYPGKLMGVNRHQDHGYVGNALPNNGQWRDALIIKRAGSDIVRAAHYPADPAFMDACDAVGLFFIVATPGWQFWNSEDAIFEQRVYQDIRDMVRRDRNRPSVIMWEPILNETAYPRGFARRAAAIVHEEYPYSGCYTVCDNRAEGQEYFDVVYAHEHNIDFRTETRCSFTREFGDLVDDFNAQNSPSRVAREWGERAQLVQAKHYAEEPFETSTWESLHRTPPQHIGGALWHAFDHQRGYHPDPFYGGLTNVFREPKYSYYMFASQRDVSEQTEPMVFIAHEMTPFSEPDVTVFTNCEEVRLTLHNGQKVIQKVANPQTATIVRGKRSEPRRVVLSGEKKMPHPIVTFENVYRFIDTKYMHIAGRKYESSILVEGLIDGKVVASDRRVAAKRPTQVMVKLEDHGVPLTANGSDFVLVVAYVADEKGVLKRLNENTIRFEVSGEGALIGDASIQANPRRLRWGTAPALIRATTNPGTITIRASLVDQGVNSPLPGELVIESMPTSERFINSEIGREPEAGLAMIADSPNVSDDQLAARVRQLEKELSDLKLKEEERNQLDFELNR